MSLTDPLDERRKALKAENEALISKMQEEKRGLDDAESATFDANLAEIRKIDEQTEELRQVELREAAAAAHRVETGVVKVTSEPNPVYRRDRQHEVSFFRDIAATMLSKANLGTSITEARDRLVRSQETRAGDVSTAPGAGGEFAPPLWLVEDYVKKLRAHRVATNLMHGEALPPGVSSINLPKVATGTTTGVQATQNSGLSDTALTTTAVSSGITTVGGKEIVSQQMIQQSGIPFDQVVLDDLSRDYALQVNKQVLYGSDASGQLNGLVNQGTAIAFTTTQPAVASTTTANSLYYTVAKAAATVQDSIFMPPSAIIMHPDRWAWIVGSVDANSRPFVIPNGANVNPVGTTGEQVAEGLAGNFGSYPVYTDPSISKTANSATNQDEIYVVRSDQLWFYESEMQATSFDATYADQASILFRVLGYVAFIPNRYDGAVQPIRGTGLVVPW